ncbi:leukotriene B4 receptor 1-like [Fundulus heteroclitus]|uniref:leukotriene B4 receptor 1-like n=1 Tax=Fundulus heteroclitus TaxID=8078 RepID=UPI00165A98CE|nr:leukotriene B4 receptor 1-like [Fundulus heteroclitus]
MDQLNFTAVPPNFSSPGQVSPPSWNLRDLIPAVVLSFCFILGVPGNIAVILLKPKWQNMSSLSRSLMLNLAISDLLCLLTLPPWIYTLLHSWTFSVETCKLLATLVYCSVYCSMLTVTAVSVQRYVVVVHRKVCNQVHKRMLLVLLWVVSVILSIPSLVFRQLKTDQKLTRCQPEYSSDTEKAVVLLSETLVGFPCLSLVAFAYIRLHKKVSQGAFFNNRQTTRLVTSIIVCFFVLWVPYYTINVLGIAAICLRNDLLLNVCKIMWNITGSLSFLNSCINPLLYAFTSEKVCIVCQKKEPLEQDSRNLRTPDFSTTSVL